MESLRPREITFLLVLLFLRTGLFSGIAAAQSDDRVEFQGKELTIVGQRSSEPTAKYLFSLYPQVMAELEQALGWKLGYKPTVVLVKDRELFERMGGSPFISAFAVPRERAVAISLPAVISQTYVLNETFKHELCHLVLHDNIRKSELPRWLDEGVCQWVSGSLGELLTGQKESASGAIDLSRHAFSLDRLSRSFPDEKYALFLAYEESLEFVEYITTKYGKEGLMHILDHMKTGDRVDEAVQKSLSLPLHTVENDWLEQLRRKNLWLIWLSQYVYEIIFFLSGVLAMLAFVKLYIRKRKYLREMEDDEEIQPDDEEE